jgi:Ca2+-binding RTX toxin-like protein
MKHIDSLESRNLLSTTSLPFNAIRDDIRLGSHSFKVIDAITASFRQGVLYISGTAKGDAISLGKNGSLLSIDPGERSIVSPILNAYDPSGSTRRDVNTIPLAEIEKIVINTANGNDLVTVSSKLDIPIEFTGGAGNDTVTGGSGDDTLSGGKGNDIIIGNLGNDELHGNAGDDVLNGGRGYNSIFGDAGTDSRPKKAIGFDYRIDSIEVRPSTGETNVPHVDLQEHLDGLSVVKLDDGRLVAEVGFTFGDKTVGLSFGEVKGTLDGFDINVDATLYRRITGGSLTLIPAHSSELRARISDRWVVTNDGSAYAFTSISGSSTRNAIDLGKLGNGDYHIRLVSGGQVLGEYRFTNNSAFKGARVDATNYLKYNNQLPSIEDLLKPSYFSTGELVNVTAAGTGTVVVRNVPV